MSENQAIRILSAGAPKAGVRKCAEAFQAKTGQAFDVEFATAPVLKERVGSGSAAADIIIAPVGALEGFTKAGQAVDGIGAVIGSVTAGVVVRNGAPEPDLASVEAFIQALLKAETLVHNEASSGQYIAKMIEGLGIGDQVAAKTVRVRTGAAVMEYLAASDGAAIGFGQITEIRLHEKLGVHLVGPLPDAVGKVTTYGVGLLSDASNPHAARPLIDFMISADGKGIFEATGVA